MFDFQVSKHPHYDEACRAFAQRHNMAKLAERAGMNVQTLRNKLNHVYRLMSWLKTNCNLMSCAQCVNSASWRAVRYLMNA